MLSAARRLAATQPQAVRALANAAVEAKLDFAELSSRVKSDEAKRAVAQLKKLMEDTRETLASQAKVRSGDNPMSVEALDGPSRRPGRAC